MPFEIRSLDTGAGESPNTNQLISLVIRLVATGAASFFLYKYISKVIDVLDPTKKQKKASEEKAQQLLKKLGKQDIKDLKLTEYELNIAAQLVVPKELPVSWQHIGGLDDIISQIKETVILPFQKHELFQKQCKLFMPPKGILLYGPPGCGKTMIAKATAKEAGCTFINIEVQQLTDKWYGESQKLAAAVFSLAYKLQPSIIFIDEIDVFLQMRSDRDHEVTAMMKATFMSLWDGLASNNNTQIMVMGATNRPQQIDQAILRRMPIRLNVAMPDQIVRPDFGVSIPLSYLRKGWMVHHANQISCGEADNMSKVESCGAGSTLAKSTIWFRQEGHLEFKFCNALIPTEDATQREHILKIVLSVEQVSSNVDYKTVAENLINFSGSDIREMCRHASVSRVHEAIKKGSASIETQLRPINTDDLMDAARVVQRSQCSELPGFLPLFSNGRK